MGNPEGKGDQHSLAQPGAGWPEDGAEAILDAALEMAEERSWAAVRLHDVAARLCIPVEDVLRHYRDLDSVANAWFRRALRAMIAPKGHDFKTLVAPERIEICPPGSTPWRRIVV